MTPATGNLRILLVEDNFDSAAALEDLLESLGHHVTVAHTLAAALAAAAGDPPDILVSDIDLPDGTGHDLMRQLAQHFHVPGVAVSGYGMEEDRRRSLAAGFDSHLTKPIGMAELKSAIARAVADRSC